MECKSCRNRYCLLILNILLLKSLFFFSVDAFTIPRSLLIQRHHSVRDSGPTTFFTSLNALIPLEVPEMKDLLAIHGSPTPAQYDTYWGRTSLERFAKWNEIGLVMLLGTLISYCLSFILGGFCATLCGVFCFSYAILGTDLQVNQRNWEFLSGRELVDPWTDVGKGLYGALYLGRVVDATVVKEASASVEYDLLDFEDYTMETDELEKVAGLPYLLRVRMQDREGRALQVHARMSEEYLDLRPNQPLAGILLSTSPDFQQLAALTDFIVPDAECWIGDYPYLDRASIERFLANDDILWDIFQDEADNRARQGDMVWKNEEDAFQGLDEDQEEDEEVLIPSRPERRRRRGRYER